MLHAVQGQLGTVSTCPPAVALSHPVPTLSTPTSCADHYQSGSVQAVTGPAYVASARRASGQALIDLQAAARLKAQDVVAPNRLDQVLARVAELRRLPQVHVEDIGVVAGTLMSVVHLGCNDPTKPPKLRVFIAAGVHGNEAAGPAAALLLVNRLLVHPELREGVEFAVLPVVNPTGYAANLRLNADQHDDNRTFHCFNAPKEVKFVRAALKRVAPDLVIDLHAAVSSDGFFAIESTPTPFLDDVLKRLAADFRVSDASRIYRRRTTGVFTSNNPGTLKGYAHAHGARWAVTLEAPYEHDYQEQVKGLEQLARNIVAAAKREAAAPVAA